MVNKNQSSRLTKQQKELKGVNGIFGDEAKFHDAKLKDVSRKFFSKLEEMYPKLDFSYKSYLLKSEINDSLKKIDSELGRTLFVEKSKISPDGGIIEVLDDKGNWRVVLVSEAKHQGKDIENIQKGKLVGANSDQDIMVAGNAIERAHKNIWELANYMLGEDYFPYVLFLEGSNFLTETIDVKRPDGRVVTLKYNSGDINRLDRLTAANYGMPLNTNLCRNKFITHNGNTIMLQAASIYTQATGGRWTAEEMMRIMFDISQTSLEMLKDDLVGQMTKK